MRHLKNLCGSQSTTGESSVGTSRSRRCARACTQCHTQKMRCNGQIPCTRCAEKSLNCSYPFGYDHEGSVQHASSSQTLTREYGMLQRADTGIVSCSPKDPEASLHSIQTISEEISLQISPNNLDVSVDRTGSLLTPQSSLGPQILGRQGDNTDSVRDPSPDSHKMYDLGFDIPIGSWQDSTQVYQSQAAFAR